MQEAAYLPLVAKAKRDYLSGLGSIAQISERYDLEPRALANRASREGWREERDAKLELTPLGDFHGELIRWKTKSNEMLGEFEEVLKEAMKSVDTNDASAVNQLACATERFINCTREVGGIPRLAPLKSAEKKEKLVTVETAPIESQSTDTQSDTQ